jgi:hypothetical protein
MLSAPLGIMILELRARADTYRIGFGVTELHVCPECGVFAAATWSDQDRLLGAANMHVMERSTFFGKPVPVDFDHESTDERRHRRRHSWTPTYISPAQ